MSSGLQAFADAGLQVGEQLAENLRGDEAGIPSSRKRRHSPERPSAEEPSAGPSEKLSKAKKARLNRLERSNRGKKEIYEASLRRNFGFISIDADECHSLINTIAAEKDFLRKFQIASNFAKKFRRYERIINENRKSISSEQEDKIAQYTSNGTLALQDYIQGKSDFNALSRNLHTQLSTIGQIEKKLKGGQFVDVPLSEDETQRPTKGA